MKIKARYEQARKDYEFLKKHHDNREPSDLTGGYVEGDKYFELLRNPCKKEAAQHYVNMIGVYATSGVEALMASGARPDLANKEVCKVFARWCFEVEISDRWDVDILNNIN